MLKQRTITALILAPLAIALVLLSPTWLLALVIGALCLIATWEWTLLAGVKTPAVRGAVVAGGAILLALAWHLRDGAPAAAIIAAGLLWWLLALAWLRHLSYAAAATPENTALKLLACALAIAPAWVALMHLHAEPAQGHYWALLALMLVWAADTGAYFAGRRFGTTKLAPRISPNKTRAGMWGALAISGVLALAGGWALGWRDAWLLGLLALALLTVLASILGDLVESLLKRQADVKDSGTLFPGHGGLLDRLDSLFAALPVFVAGKALLDLLRAS